MHVMLKFDGELDARVFTADTKDTLEEVINKFRQDGKVFQIVKYYEHKPLPENETCAVFDLKRAARKISIYQKNKKNCSGL